MYWITPEARAVLPPFAIEQIEHDGDHTGRETDLVVSYAEGNGSFWIGGRIEVKGCVVGAVKQWRYIHVKGDKNAKID